MPWYQSDEHRLLNQTIKRGDDECWTWIGSVHHKGYGQLGVTRAGKTKWYSAHRFSYETFRGPIPDGLIVCHRCDNPLCVNPNHLFVGTHLENMNDMRAKGRARRYGRPRKEVAPA